ncbi:DUF4124 domain-containing protein [Coralloluteibacterium thermophilus]|uniref:DUF4124 domain-containing protein n=1 Tax=Coralloluteibacterium thermophilum TaxID=2707049 RepID=A0ABV9NJJ5_9GAMM
MRIIVGCIAVALAAAGVAHAQKLYRWVDGDGQVRYSDHLPPEEVDRARREISFASGLVTGEVERALTPEERAEAEAEARRRAQAAQLQEKAIQRDGVLLGSYPTEADLRRAYDERVGLLEETLKATRIGIDAQRQSLMSLLGHAADQELAGRAVPARTRESVVIQRAQLDDQLLALNQREAERAALDLEYRDTLARYRELQAARAR